MVCYLRAVPVPDSLANDPAIAGPLGSLALSHVRAGSSSLALRAVRWHEGLIRLGVVLPFMLVHDVGLLFSSPRDQLDIGPRASAQVSNGRLRDGARLSEMYRSMLEELGESEAARRAPQLKMSDDLVIVILSRILGTIAARTTTAPAYRASIPVDAPPPPPSPAPVVAAAPAADAPAPVAGEAAAPAAPTIAVPTVAAGGDVTKTIRALSQSVATNQ